MTIKICDLATTNQKTKRALSYPPSEIEFKRILTNFESFFDLTN